MKRGPPQGQRWRRLVAPCAGAGIETLVFICYLVPPLSPPARGRGLKHFVDGLCQAVGVVAPCAGAGIEMQKNCNSKIIPPRRPLRGGGD